METNENRFKTSKAVSEQDGKRKAQARTTYLLKTIKALKTN